MNTLKQEKEFGKIEVLSRVQVILDAFSFSWTAELSYKFVFDLVQYLKFENEYLPWRVTLRKFADLRYLLLRTEIYGAFQVCIIFLQLSPNNISFKIGFTIHIAKIKIPITWYLLKISTYTYL